MGGGVRNKMRKRERRLQSPWAMDSIHNFTTPAEEYVCICRGGVERAVHEDRLAVKDDSGIYLHGSLIDHYSR